MTDEKKLDFAGMGPTGMTDSQVLGLPPPPEPTAEERTAMGGRLTIRLPNWMRAKLDAEAAARGVTVSEVVKSALKGAL